MADAESDGGCVGRLAATRELIYPMNSPRRGVAVIFSQELFLDLYITQYLGAEANCQSLVKTFTKLGFQVELHKELSLAKIKDRLKELSERDHSDCDCFVLTFMCHGTDGKLSARDEYFEFHILWERFTDEACPTLANKPKIFIVEACQGHSIMRFVNIYEEKKNLTVDQGNVQLIPPYQLPKSADFLISLSTAPGFLSWRNKYEGSRYIQAICSQLDNHRFDHDMLSLLTRVNGEVAINYATYDKVKKVTRKQLPFFISSLTQRLMFTKKPLKQKKSSKKKRSESHLKDGKRYNEEDARPRNSPKILNNGKSRRKRLSSKYFRSVEGKLRKRKDKFY